jgi:hypothetical protein
MNIEEALKNISNNDLAVIQTSVLMGVVGALIKTHPNKDELYRVFDFAYSNLQVGMSGSGSPAGSAVARHLIESLFGIPET